MPTYLSAEARLSIRKLRTAFSACSVRVVTVPDLVLERVHKAPTAGDSFAICDAKGRVLFWRIRIARGCTAQEQVDALCHEWAHALDELENGAWSRDCHRDSFGKWWARCHKAITDEVLCE